MPREFCCLLLQPGNDVATVGTPIKSTQDKSIRDLRAVKSVSFSRLYYKIYVSHYKQEQCLILIPDGVEKIRKWGLFFSILACPVFHGACLTQ